MANDGLIFRCLGRVHSGLKTPLIATLIAGAIAGTMAAIFDLRELVELDIMAALLTYTLVAFSILILRY